MRSKQSMPGGIHPLMWRHLSLLYQAWLLMWTFGRHAGLDDKPQVVTIRTLLRFAQHFMALETPKARVINPDDTLLELMQQQLCVKGEYRSLAEWANLVLCRNVVEALLQAAPGDSSDPEDIQEHQQLLADCGYRDWSEVEAMFSSEAAKTELAAKLFTQLCDTLGGRPIRSFFIAMRHAQGFFAWHTKAFSGYGKALRTNVYSNPFGEVRVRVASYPKKLSGDNVVPYEWQAELRSDPDSELPDAAANGMVYRMVREKGKPCGTVRDLVLASDVVSDIDVAQVTAFIEQHPDAQDLLDEGDVCFVWLWERYAEVPKGAGEACLAAALADLKKRFRYLKTLVVSVVPLQFIELGHEDDPPLIQLERQSAIDKLQRLLDETKPERHIKGELRCIVPTYLNSQQTQEKLIEILAPHDSD